MISNLFDQFLHIDKYLASLTFEYGIIIYLILFIIIFAETGLVVTPFLPGDSLLFVAGALSAIGYLNIFLLLFLVSLAAILGDTLNYSLGQLFGPKIFRKENRLLFKEKHLFLTKKFYYKHGSKTIILSRFIPLLRTFAPFVAGLVKMHYPKFLFYNIIGGILWTFLFIIGGYLFGNISFVRENFGLVIIFILLLSLLPMLIHTMRNGFGRKNIEMQKRK